MKKLFTYLALSLSTLAVQSQIAETVLLNETFESGIDASISASGELSSSLDLGFDGVSGVAELFVEDFIEDLLLSWEVATEATDADSIVAEFKIGKSSINTIVTQNGNSFSTTSRDIELIVVPSSTGTFVQHELVVVSEFFSLDDYDLVEDNTDYFTVQKTYETPTFSSINLINMYKTVSYEIDGESFSDASEWCDANADAVVSTCATFLTTQLVNLTGSTSLLIDDVKVTSYETVTGIEDKIYNDKQVLAVYNLMGQDSRLETTNEMIIVKYTDGTSERVFNVK